MGNPSGLSPHPPSTDVSTPRAVSSFRTLSRFARNSETASVFRLSREAGRDVGATGMSPTGSLRRHLEAGIAWRFDQQLKCGWLSPLGRRDQGIDFPEIGDEVIDVVDIRQFHASP